MTFATILSRFPRVQRALRVLLISTLVGGGTAIAVAPTSALSLQSPAVSVRVSGNHLVDAGGHVVRLLGVDRSGAEFACIGGSGIFNGPTDAASVGAMTSWHINAVRVPLNEDCWLGINGVKPAVSGAAYQAAIKGYVQTLHAAGLVVILDLHWNAAGTTLATGQQVMADADHSPAFWASVASSFKSDPGVVFDLYNEPHDISLGCWRDGCWTGGWRTAGMQSLINAVRSTGATQPVMIGSVGWAGDFSHWLAYRPTDPAKSIVASLHLYDFSGCVTTSCWDGTFGPVAAQFPIVTGEMGETDCGHTFIDGYMKWADSHGVSYLGWTWNADGWSCSAGPSLISSYNGTPSGFGIGLKNHLAIVGPSPTTTSPPTTSRPTTTTPPATIPKATGVTVAYRVVNQWFQGVPGLQASIDITNTGTTPIGTSSSPWTLKFTLPTTVTMRQLWDATYTSPRAGAYTVVAPSWHQSIAPGQTFSFGYVIDGGHPGPSGCIIDNASCAFVWK